MPWSRLQSASAIGTGSNPSVAYGTSLTSGSKLIAAVALDGDASETTAPNVWTVKDGSGNTMTFLAGIINGSSSALCLYAMDTPAGDAGAKPTITATFGSFGGSDFGSALLIQEVSGLLAGNTTAMLDGTAGTSDGSSSGPATTGSYSSTASSEYLVAVYGDNGGNFSYTNPPSGYSADANNVLNNTNAQLGIDYKNSGNTSESASWTLGATIQWCTLLVAFQLGGPIATPGPPLVPIPGSRPVIVAGFAGRTGAGHSL